MLRRANLWCPYERRPGGRYVDQETMLHHLEELAESLGIEVLYQSAAGRVGVCRLRGSRVAIVDSNLRVAERVAALASVLADEDLNGVYIPPAVRRRLLASCPLRVRPGEEEQAPANGYRPNADRPDAGDAEPDADADAEPDTSPGEVVHEDGADHGADAD